MLSCTTINRYQYSVTSLAISKLSFACLGTWLLIIGDDTCQSSAISNRIPCSEIKLQQPTGEEIHFYYSYYRSSVCSDPVSYHTSRAIERSLNC